MGVVGLVVGGAEALDFHVPVARLVTALAGEAQMKPLKMAPRGLQGKSTPTK